MTMFYHNHIYDDRPNADDLNRKIKQDGIANFVLRDVLLTCKSKQTGNTYEQIGVAALDSSNENIVIAVYIKRFWLGYSVAKAKNWIDMRPAVNDDYIRAQRQVNSYKKLDEAFLSDLKKI